MDVSACRDIVWRASNNDWFEYPFGSRLNFFRWPAKYRSLARDGVPIHFLGPPPKSMKPQPGMDADEEKVLREKLLKIIKKRYIVVPDERLRSLIMYFGVPKGVFDGVIQDWHIVYHIGANGLNDSVWAPTFWLPKVDSLLRMLDLDSLMEDQDMGEMFLNFELHPEVRKFVGVDINPLNIDEKQCQSRWLYWVRNLMGFKPSPYNSVRMALIGEEIICGDRHDVANAFQWDVVRLNLPGSEDYTPSLAWISKRRMDGSLASDFVCFVDDQRLAGANTD